MNARFLWRRRDFRSLDLWFIEKPTILFAVGGCDGGDVLVGGWEREREEMK